VKRKTILSMAWENMKQRKLRTSLTTLGIVIGIAAIVSISSLGEGFRSSITTQVTQFELDVIMVMPSGLTGSSQMRLTEENATSIQNNITDVKVATHVKLVPFPQVFKDGSHNATTFAVLGVNFTEFKEIYPGRFNFEQGSLPESLGDNPIILGHEVAHQKGEITAEVGDTVRLVISSNPPVSLPVNFTVAGILEESGAGSLISLDTCVLVPANMTTSIPGVDMIFVKVADQDYAESIAEDIRSMFNNQVSTLVPSIMLRNANSILNFVEIFLASISSIALVVAGIGIMNIMTVSVMERTREIGILKAVGAKSRNILTMFLAEATLIGLIGALFGVPAGYGLAQLLGYTMTSFRLPQGANPQIPIEQISFTITPVLSPTLVLGAIFFGVVVSVLFGWYPARKAAKMDPVQALRHE